MHSPLDRIANNLRDTKQGNQSEYKTNQSQYIEGRVFTTTAQTPPIQIKKSAQNLYKYSVQNDESSSTISMSQKLFLVDTFKKRLVTHIFFFTSHPVTLFAYMQKSM